MVLLVVDDFDDAGVDDHFGAGKAWGEGDIDGCLADADAVVGGLGDGVLLGVGADAVAERGPGGGIAGASIAAAIAAVANAARGAVVAGRDDAAVLDDDGGHLAATAVSTCFDDVGDIHEVGVPIGAIEYLCAHGAKSVIAYGGGTSAF